MTDQEVDNIINETLLYIELQEEIAEFRKQLNEIMNRNNKDNG